MAKNDSSKIFNNLKTIYTCIAWAIDSRSARISCRVLVPKTFLRVVAARSWVDLGASSTFVTLVILVNFVQINIGFKNTLKFFFNYRIKYTKIYNSINCHCNWISCQNLKLNKNNYTFCFIFLNWPFQQSEYLYLLFRVNTVYPYLYLYSVRFTINLIWNEISFSMITYFLRGYIKRNLNEIKVIN